jgi:hypothetical protein
MSEEVRLGNHKPSNAPLANSGMCWHFGADSRVTFAACATSTAMILENPASTPTNLTMYLGVVPFVEPLCGLQEPD